MVDNLKLSVTVALLVAAVGAFYYYAEQSMLYRVLGLLALTGIAIGIALTTEIGRRSAGYLRDSRNEVRKVVWPSRKETTQTTLLVAAMVIVVGIILWLFDALLLWAVQLLTGQGS